MQTEEKISGIAAAEPNRAQPQLSDTVDISPIDRLEQLSVDIMFCEADTKNVLNEYYLRLAEDTHKQNDGVDELYSEVEGEVASLKATAANLKKSRKHVAIMADELSSRLREVKRCRKRQGAINVATPANSIIDFEEKASGHFAQGINFYKLVWICFIGSFVGVIVELLWCLAKNGYIESRSGLVYGPFNLLYGAGAVSLTLALYRYRNRSSSISFIGGMIVGSIVEYVCSWGQELVFGTSSWDYSDLPFNINGRICLRYSVFWGILGLLWVKKIYPRMSQFILLIPNKIGKIVTWLIVAFMAVNIIVTVTAVYRWTERISGDVASNAFEEFVDRRFPNERMEHIFANMKFPES